MDAKELRIVFMGTPEIAATVLEGILQAGYQVVGVVAQPDRPIGRKQILMPVPTKKVAIAHQIPCFQPVKIRLDYSFLIDLKPDIVVTIAYGQIVPQAVLDIPPLGCVNLHGSLLPKYRGAAPIQHAIWRGEKVSGMTLMKMVKAMDAGEMYGKKEIAIDEEENSSSLFHKMGIAALELILEYLPKFAEGNVQGIEQDESEVSFAPTIKPEEEKINLDNSSEEIVNQVRALADEPGAYLLLNDEKIKIFKARKYSFSVSQPAGTITKADKTGLIFQAKDGEVEILELQKQGKNRMGYKDFINGSKDLTGKVLK